MKKIILLLAFVPLIIDAQVIKFEQIAPLPPASQNITEFTGVYNGTVNFADIDGDGDQDLLITGSKEINVINPVTELYTNDGAGNFSFVTNTPFTGVQGSSSSVVFADVDGDNDQDVLITGQDYLGNPINELYTNDGLGNFTLVIGEPFIAGCPSSVAFADVDGDNDLDLFITGFNTTSYYSSVLYKNDGAGNFSVLTDTTFTNISGGDIAFADVDNDGDQDVLITGSKNSPSALVAELYTNNGLGMFTLVTSTPFIGVRNSSVAFSDIDGDNDQDVIITGQDHLNTPITKLYTNNGSGNYTLVTSTSFTGVNYGLVAFADVDNDNDQDVLIYGRNTPNTYTESLYLNDGLGNYIFLPQPSFTKAFQSSAAFADIDGDNDQDIFMTGVTDDLSSTLYTNDGVGNYSRITGCTINGVFKSSLAFADIDNDNDQDLLITGSTSFVITTSYTGLYTNDGEGNYIYDSTGTTFPAVSGSSIAFADIDGDNDQDVLITGANVGQISNLYKNNGTGNFSLVGGTPFTAVSDGSVAFADIDNDGDQDLLLTGSSGSISISNLYKNNGSGNYTLVTGTPFTGVSFSSIAFADIDGDSDQDVLITGYNSSSNIQISQLYKNNGTGAYTLVTGTPFIGVERSSIAFADIDGDNNQDVLITGKTNSGVLISELYKNDGSGNFTLVSGMPFAKVFYGSVAFSDVDNDNDQDLLITGMNISDSSIAELYSNDGLGNFLLETNVHLKDGYAGSAVFSDIDGDTDKDLIITGRHLSPYDDTHLIFSRLYRNVTCYPSASIDIQSACSPYTWIDGNTYVTSDTTSTYVLTNVAGCDSIITLHLNMNYTIGDTTTTNCDNFTWYGTTYYASGNYTHTLKNIAGCDSIVTLHLNINHIASDTTATACDNFTWRGIQHYSSGNFKDTLQNIAGCDSIITLHLTIKVSPNPSISLGTSLDKLVLTAYPINATYQWLDCSNNYAPIIGKTHQSDTLINNGNYAVKVTQNGCSDTSACYNIITAGIQDYENQSFKVYPNPVSNKLTIESSENIKAIEVYNLVGELLQATYPTTNSFTIDFSTYVKGVYMIKISSSNGDTSIVKIVKE